MSQALLQIAKAFVSRNIDAETFVDTYIAAWRKERDCDLLLDDSDILSIALSSIFCIADLYNPEDDREHYEFDAHTLLSNVQKILNESSLL